MTTSGARAPHRRAARRELGFDPRPLEQGLAQTLLAEMVALGMDPPERLRERAAARHD